jgi:hypothetical protein
MEINAGITILPLTQKFLEMQNAASAYRRSKLIISSLDCCWAVLTSSACLVFASGEAD